MSLHPNISLVIERCRDSESTLAIFKAEKPNKFNVLFADSVQTQIDIKKKRGFIGLFEVGGSLDDLEKLLKESK